jgi:hypothetical protein
MNSASAQIARIGSSARIDTKRVRTVKSNDALENAAAIWTCTTIVGQWLFVCYILSYHGSLLLQHGLEGLGRTHLPVGYVAGDTFGNVTLSTHILLAAVMIGAGTLQLLPSIRARHPALHRWSGRFYIPSAVLLAIAGLYTTWTRSGSEHLVPHIGNSINGVLIVVFASMTLRYALKRDFAAHRVFALRLFMSGSAIWFLQIGFSLWFFISDAFGITFKHFFDVWLFGQYLIPLAILELYLRAKRGGGARQRAVVAAVVLCATAVLVWGLYLTATAYWLPRVVGAN